MNLNERLDYYENNLNEDMGDEENIMVAYQPIDEGFDIKSKHLTCKIFVYGNEGYIPHFHLKKSDGTESCLCIFEAKYFNHENKHKILTDKELYTIDTFMSFFISDGRSKISNWDKIVKMWVDKNSSNGFEHMNDWFEFEQPDYTLTRENRYQGNNNNNRKR